MSAHQPASRCAGAAAEYIAVVAKSLIDLRVQDEAAGAHAKWVEAGPLTRSDGDTGTRAIAGHASREIFRQQFCPQATIGEGAGGNPCSNPAGELEPGGADAHGVGPCRRQATIPLTDVSHGSVARSQGHA